MRPQRCYLLVSDFTLYVVSVGCFEKMCFGATVCKTVRPMLSVRFLSVCLSVLSDFSVHALWPNGWTDESILKVGLMGR